MSKNILAILGSPHKKGITAEMLSIALNSAKGKGYSVNTINLYDKDITYCQGCCACYKTRQCVIKDDITEVARLINECDIVILAAPVYWANVPAVVKNMFDRLLGVAMEKTNTFPKSRLKGKKYIFLTACHTPFPFSKIFGQSTGAIKAVREVFKTAGMKCMGNFVCANKNKVNHLLSKKIRNSIK